MDDAVAALRSAADAYERLIVLPGVTPKLIMEASTAIQTLGDELCQDDGLANSETGLVAYRRSLALDERAIQLDPNYMAARRGPAYMHLHIGSVNSEVDPARSLAEFRLASSILDSLPQTEQKKLFQRRLHAILIRKQAMSLAELGEYSQASPLFEMSATQFRELLSADRHDPLALGDMKRGLDAEADSYAYAANPILADVPADRLRNLRLATDRLEQEAEILRELAKQAADRGEFKTELANVMIRLNTVRNMVHATAATSATRDSLELLKKAADQANASLQDLEFAISAFLNVQPATLRDARQAISWAERGINITHHKNPGLLLLLAQAYREAGQPQQAIATARQGLSLLPPDTTANRKTRVRRLLEAEVALDGYTVPRQMRQ